MDKPAHGLKTFLLFHNPPSKQTKRSWLIREKNLKSVLIFQTFKYIVAPASITDDPDPLQLGLTIWCHVNISFIGNDFLNHLAEIKAENTSKQHISAVCSR